LSHLAADTVAHHAYTADKKNIRHTVLEMKADCIIDKKYRQQAMEIDRKIQIRNDIFLENSLDRFIFSFKTNKRILRGMVFLTIFYPEQIGDFIDKSLLTNLPARETIEKLHRDSLDNTIDLFRNWEKSEVVKINPIGSGHRRKLLRSELKAFLFKPLGKTDPAFSRSYKRIGMRRAKDI
jgi:hypothetical protein